ncbi:hypothetical protein ACFVW8_29655 [Streptomyces sp. NPDC058221]|uniref:hypothetical protein n=1 Tax=Streptomyces sp. NPDC058221 TaxID=3346388 RepID=UPI0036EA6732
MAQKDTMSAPTVLDDAVGTSGPDLLADPGVPGRPVTPVSHFAFDEYAESWGTGFELGMLKLLGLA